MASNDPDPSRIDPAPERISIYRSAEAGRVFAEKAARAGELSEDVVRELRDIHSLIRQRALGTSPQGRLV